MISHFRNDFQVKQVDAVLCIFLINRMDEHRNDYCVLLLHDKYKKTNGYYLLTKRDVCINIDFDGPGK